MINLEDFVGEMKKAKTSLKEIEHKLSTLQVTGEAGAGLVKVTLDGNKQFLHIEIDESLLKPTEKTTLQDLTVAAINIALEKLQKTAKQEVSQIVGLPSIFQDLLQGNF